MQKELSCRQLAFLSAIILFGRLSLIGESAVGRDIWLVFIAVPILAIPLIKIYSAIRFKDEKTVNSLFTASFGKFFGIAAITLTCLIAIIIASSGITLFTVFISSTPVENNLLIPSVIVMCITIGLLMYVSEDSLGRSSTVIFPIIVVLLTVSVIASLKHMDFGALLPIAEEGPDKITKGIMSAIGFQVAPLIFLIFSTARGRSSKCVFRGTVYGLLASCALLLIAHLRNVLILGYPAVSLFRFPNYVALTQISMGDLFQGMEIIMTQAFLLCQPIKSAMCLRFVRQALSEAFPKTQKVWTFALPILAGVLTLLNYGESYDLIISNAYMRALVSGTLIGIPVLMALSLKLRKKLP